MVHNITRQPKALRMPRVIRCFATQSPPPEGGKLSKEQEELLRLLREAEQKTEQKAHTQARGQMREQSMGLAGVALNQGAAASGPTRVDKWTGLGKKWGDLSGGQKGMLLEFLTSEWLALR